MSKNDFVRFDCLAFDLASGKHNWNDHKLKLVLMAVLPNREQDSVSGIHSVSLMHKMTRDGRSISLSIDTAIARAAGPSIGPFSAIAIVNASSGAPVMFADLGEPATLEDGSSMEFKFPADVLFVTA